MKNKFIAGNWKMNNTSVDTEALLTQLIPLVKDTKNTVAVCVPFTDLCIAKKMLLNTNILLGAQNIHWAQKGAFTGEISSKMLSEKNVKCVIIGHSERREYFGETNKTVNQRLLTALNDGFTPIVCIGESLEQRKNGQTEAFLATQIKEGFEGLSAQQMEGVVVAYEPIWAIGTGVTATTQQAQETIAFIRKTIAETFGSETAQKVYILYGGSMNENNARDLLSMPDIDGGLIGGASLVAEKFAKIVNAI